VDSCSEGFIIALYAAGGVAAAREFIVANPDVVGALIDAKPEFVGGGRVSYVDDVCRDCEFIGGVLCCGGGPECGGRGPGDAGRPLTA
jgi:hypothetical protein